jgi:hypothetical protein
MQIENPPYFGCIVGRYAGRIRHGKVKIGDEELQLTTNNGGHHLHGGFHSLSSVFWGVEENQDSNQLTFSYVCPAGSENYPGELKVLVTYSLTEQNELKINRRYDHQPNTASLLEFRWTRQFCQRSRNKIKFHTLLRKVHGQYSNWKFRAMVLNSYAGRINDRITR